MLIEEKHQFFVSVITYIFPFEFRQLINLIQIYGDKFPIESIFYIRNKGT
jgi:hypothetical protein